ncbi:MAG: hypothetical protein ACRCR9_03985 [Chitinophagaceae bacterium]
MKYTQATFDNLKKILEMNSFEVRLEKEIKSRFKSGHCILEERKLIIINKFLELGGRIQILLEITIQLKDNIQQDKFNEHLKKFYNEHCLQKRIELNQQI